jgi:hypothetical protein
VVCGEGTVQRCTLYTSALLTGLSWLAVHSQCLCVRVCATGTASLRQGIRVRVHNKHRRLREFQNRTRFTNDS